MNRIVSTVRNINKLITSSVYYRQSSYILKKNMSTKVYTETHEWNIKNNNIITVGLSNYAMKELGEVVYLEFPSEIKDKLELGDDIVIIESVKAADSIKAHSDLKIIDLNFDLENNLDKLNEEPENENTSWIAKIQIQD